MIKSVINIEASRQQVFSVLSDFSRYQEWMPGCKASRVVSESGNTVQTEFTIQSIKTMILGLQFDIQPDQLMTFHMIKGKDLRAYSGSWRLMDSADGSGTVVMGDIEMDAGAMVPKFMVSRMAQKAIDDTGKALQARVRSIPMTPAAQAAAAVRVAGRAKRILHVMRTSDGYRVWLLGQSFQVRQLS